MGALGNCVVVAVIDSEVSCTSITAVTGTGCSVSPASSLCCELASTLTDAGLEAAGMKHSCSVQRVWDWILPQDFSRRVRSLSEPCTTNHHTLLFANLLVLRLTLRAPVVGTNFEIVVETAPGEQVFSVPYIRLAPTTLTSASVAGGSSLTPIAGCRRGFSSRC